MKCNHCKGEWAPPPGRDVTECPFCGKGLAKKEEPRVYENSRDALAAIMEMYGAEVLLGKLNNLFRDLAPAVSKVDKELVDDVYEKGAAQILKNNLAATQADKVIAVKRAVKKLTDAHIAQNSAETIIHEFTAALGWKVEKPVPTVATPSDPITNPVPPSLPSPPPPIPPVAPLEPSKKHPWSIVFAVIIFIILLIFAITQQKPREQPVSHSEPSVSVAVKTTSEPSVSVTVKTTSEPSVSVTGKTTPEPPASVTVKTAPEPSVGITEKKYTDIAQNILQGERRNLPFGGYNWRVLYVQGYRALLITEDVIEQRLYNEQDVSVTWETCTLRQYLNNEFLQKFTGEERGKIIETWIINPDNLWYGAWGGYDTTDKIFLLSLEEVDRYFGNSGDYQQKRRKKSENGKWIADDNGWSLSNAHDSDRQAKFNNEACWWWLRSPGLLSNSAARVTGDGSVSVSGNDVDIDSGGVRPAFWLNLKF